MSAMERIFSLEEKWNVRFNEAIAECTSAYSNALMGNMTFILSISRDHNQPIQRFEFSEVLYNTLIILS